MSPSQSDSLLTLVVVTSNRPAMLRRHLRYLSEIRCPFRVVVADSSRPEIAIENRSTVAGASRLKLHYGYSEAGPLEVCRNVLRRRVTPYASVFGDGDFPFPAILHQALDFLEQNPGYGSAIGTTASDLVRKDRCYVLPARSITNDSPVVRFRTLARTWFSTLPGVHRTQVLHETYRNTASCTDFFRGRRFVEVMLSQMAVLQSRVHVLPRICCLQEDREPLLAATPRNDDNRSFRRKPGQFLSLRRHVRQADAEAPRSGHRLQYDRFCENLVEQLEAAGATRDHAELMMQQLYGHMSDESASIVARKPPGLLGKLQRETIRHYGRLVSLFRSDRVLQRRPLRHGDLLGLNAEWTEARQLLALHPDGIVEDGRSSVAA